MSDEHRTAGPAYSIMLKSDTSKIVSGNQDSLAYITASVVGRSGEIVPDAYPRSYLHLRRAR